jgi:hypothetical protein
MLVWVLGSQCHSVKVGEVNLRKSDTALKNSFTDYETYKEVTCIAVTVFAIVHTSNLLVCRTKITACIWKKVWFSETSYYWYKGSELSVLSGTKSDIFLSHPPTASTDNLYNSILIWCSRYSNRNVYHHLFSVKVLYAFLFSPHSNHVPSPS